MTDCPTCSNTRTVRLEPAGPGEWWYGPCLECSPSKCDACEEHRESVSALYVGDEFVMLCDPCKPQPLRNP